MSEEIGGGSATHLGHVWIETYGCQMNMNDSEVVASILREHGYSITDRLERADVVLLNTCSIRENAENRVMGRLELFARHKRRRPGLLVGVLGCMAERLKEQLLEADRSVDLVVGPDAYRELPKLLAQAHGGLKAINVLLSREETYADISPVRLDRHGVSAFVSIMRGCDNRCAYCVVPQVRGAERSRSPQSILREVQDLHAAGYREVTLLGQNVNSYRWAHAGLSLGFAQLLERVAQSHPTIRIRYSTSHPRDLSDELLHVMARHPNLCQHIHLPVQSGSTRILGLMSRGYSREFYMERVDAIRRILPECAISTDIIAGFCSETPQDHQDTLSLMRWAQFDFAFMFKYSERPGTEAALRLADDVPDGVKTERLNQIIALQGELSLAGKLRDVGKQLEVLVEGPSKRSREQLFGRTSQNRVVVFPHNGARANDTVRIAITHCTSATLIGHIVEGQGSGP